jgi:putative Holliday junction resolvase
MGRDYEVEYYSNRFHLSTSSGCPVASFPFRAFRSGEGEAKPETVLPVHIDGFKGVCSNNCMGVRGRILAIDYGEKNVGLAYSDELGLTVQPIPSMPNRGSRDLFRKLQDTIRSMEIRELVLGIPLNMNGTRGDSVIHMERLMDMLKSKLGIPLHGVDERLSTVEAMEFWRELSRKQQKKYRTVDSLAAALILERYLKEI